MTAVAGIGGGGGHTDLLDGVPNLAAGLPLKHADHVIRHLVFHLEIVLFGHISPVVGHEHGGKIHDTGALGGALRVGVVQADCGLDVVGADLLHQVVLLDGIGGVINKVVVAGDAQLLRRAVEAQEQGEAAAGKLPAVGGPDHLLGHGLLLQHLAKHQMGGAVGDDVASLDHLAVGELHAADLAAVIGQDLFGLGVVPNIAAQLPDAGIHSQADLMGAHLWHPGIPGDIADDHGAVVQKAHAVAVHAQIAPISVEDILGLLGHFQGIQHLIDRIAARLDKVGEGLLHIVRVGVAVDGVGIGLGVPHLVAQLKELRDGFPGFRAVLHHLVNKGLLAKGHDTVILFIGGNEVIRLGDAHPIDLVLHAQVAEQRAHITGLFRGTKIIKLMQAGLKFKASPLEAGGKSAGQIVLFQQQTGVSSLQNPNGGNQTAVACAYDHHVIGFFRFCCHSVPPSYSHQQIS